MTLNTNDPRVFPGGDPDPAPRPDPRAEVNRLAAANARRQAGKYAPGSEEARYWTRKAEMYERQVEARAATLALGVALLDEDAGAETVNAAIRANRVARGLSEDDPEFPDGEFGRPFAEPQADGGHYSDAEINQMAALYFERLLDRTEDEEDLP